MLPSDLHRHPPLLWSRRRLAPLYLVLGYLIGELSKPVTGFAAPLPRSSSIRPFLHAQSSRTTTTSQAAFAPSSSSPQSGTPSQQHTQKSRSSRKPLFYRNRAIHEDQYSSDSTVSRPEAANTLSRTTSRYSGMNLPMIRNLCLSQAALLAFSTAIALVCGVDLIVDSGISLPLWTATDGTVALLPEDPWLWGLVAAVPMIFLGHKVESSDARAASYVNFSTHNMVVTLFGRRRRLDVSNSLLEGQGTSTTHPTTSTADVLCQSLVLTLLTSTTEEVVFRLWIPLALVSLTHSVPLALIGQAFLFGLGHTHYQSKAGENVLIGSLQTLNGLWYGALYVLAGGSLLPGMVAHILYDWHVLVETWHVVNEQLDWAEKSHPLSPQEASEIRALQQQAGSALTNETLLFGRRFFYAFDRSQQETLSLADTQRAITYAFTSGANPLPTPSTSEVESIVRQIWLHREILRSEERVTLPEFLRVLFTLRAHALEQVRKGQGHEGTELV